MALVLEPLALLRATGALPLPPLVLEPLALLRATGALPLPPTLRSRKKERGRRLFCGDDRGGSAAPMSSSDSGSGESKVSAPALRFDECAEDRPNAGAP